LNPLINELLGWYTQTMFPTDTSNEYAVNHLFNVNNYDQVLPQNISGSPLCHISVTGWCNSADFSSGSTERKERCARLTGDVAAYTVKYLTITSPELSHRSMFLLQVLPNAIPVMAAAAQ